MKLRLIAKGWSSYTGYLGSAKFTNGVSDELSQPQANQIAAVVRCEPVDENDAGDMVGNVYNANKGKTTEDLDLRTAVKVDNEQAEAEAEDGDEDSDQAAEEGSDTDESHSADATDATDDAGSDAGSIDKPVEITGKPGYTRKQLEAVADKDGIAGLRAIADPIGVRDNSIKGLINEILEVAGDKSVVSK